MHEPAAYSHLMRKPRLRAAFALAALAVLVAAESARGHVFPTPTYVATGSTSAIELSVPNERRVAMTAFEIRVPEGLVVAGVPPVDGWVASATARAARWTAGSLPPFATAAFAIELDVTGEPGTVVLDAVERYRDGRSVRWPMTLAVIPPADEPSQQLGVAVVVGVAGLLGLTIAAALLWRRAGRALQEK